MAAEKNQPVYQYRLGKIVGTVWFNEDDNGRGTHSVQIAPFHGVPAVAAERRTTRLVRRLRRRVKSGPQVALPAVAGGGRDGAR